MPKGPDTKALPHEEPMHGDSHDAAHHIPLKAYYTVYVVLMLLLFLTVGAAAVDLGAAGNIAFALLIAFIKVGAIMYIFMHLKYATPLVRVFALVAAFWLLIMFGFTMSDYMSRDWMPGSGSLNVPKL
jgi:cytochrome c oxidase subunit IV